MKGSHVFYLWHFIKCLCICLATPYGLSLAQDFWTLQTGAFSDYRDASKAVSELQTQGYDAYSEFFMQEGKQLVRVRLGCFDAKPTAEQFVKTTVLVDTLIVPMTQGSPVGLCIGRKVGAVIPQDVNAWGIYQAYLNSIEFWFSAQSVTAFLSFNGSSWNLADKASPATSTAASQDAGYFREEAGLIKLYYPNRSVLTLTSGKLIWQYGLNAVILEDDVLAAYQLSVNGQ